MLIKLLGWQDDSNLSYQSLRDLANRGDGATTSDQWRFALSWPVARQLPSSVKGALLSAYVIGHMSLS